MKAPGSGILKVVGILYVIFAGIAIIGLLIAIGGTALLARTLGLNVTVLTLVYIIGLISAAYRLFVGIIGIKESNNLEKAGFLRTLGIVDIVLAGATIIFSGVMLGFGGVVLELVGLVLPILFLVGASKNFAARNGQ
ncbi:MAG: hypothetical protein FWC90_02830 [Oscillospiraceae bacterium]|nr:hypothetical protein [Oscillospiraceae bacterium]